MRTLEDVTNFLKRDAELQNLKDEVERLREALRKYACRCDEPCVRLLMCGDVARKALGEKE